MEKLKIFLYKIGSHPNFQSDVSAVSTTNFFIVHRRSDPLSTTVSVIESSTHWETSSMGSRNGGQQTLWGFRGHNPIDG